LRQPYLKEQAQGLNRLPIRTNLERNAINASIFEQHIQSTHPTFESLSDPINHTIIAEWGE